MIKKTLIVFCIFTLTFFIGAYIFMRSSLFTDRVHLMMESLLERRLGRQVSVGKVTGNIFGNIKIDGISIAKGDKLSDGKLIDVEEVRAGYSLLGLLRWRFVIKSISIIRPHIWLERDEEGKFNVPELAAPEDEGKKSRFSVLISKVDIFFGKIIIDDKLNSIYSTVSGVNGKLRGTGGERGYLGEFRAYSAEIDIQGASGTISDLSVLLETSEREVNISKLKFNFGKSYLEADAKILTDTPMLASATIESKKLFLEDISQFFATPGTDMPSLEGMASIYGVINGKLPDIGGVCVVSIPAMKANDLEIRNVDAEVKFTPNAVGLTYLSADLTHGGAKLSGTLQFNDGKISKHDVTLKMEGLDIAEIITGLSGADVPVSGRLSGEISAKGAEPRPGKIAMDGRATISDAQWKGAESAVAPIGVVEALLSVRGEYMELDVSWEKTRVKLKGKLSNDGGLKLTAEADMPDVKEITSLLADSPSITGKGRVSAEASMKIVEPTFLASMGLPLSDLRSGIIDGIADLRGQANVYMPDLRLSIKDGGEATQLGSLTGVVHLVDDNVKIDEMLLQLNESECRLEAEIQLKKDGKRLIDATLTLDSLQVKDYTSLIGGLQISGGLLNGNLGLHGEMADMDGGGEIVITDLPLGQRNIERIYAPIEIKSNVLNIPNLVASSLGERITASCSLTAQGDYDFKADSSWVELSRLFPDAVSIGGAAQVSLSGGGNTSSPSLKGSLNLKGVRYEDENFGDGGIDFALRDEKIYVDVSLSNRSLIATLDASAQHPFPFSGIVQLGNINLEPALNLAGIGEKIDLRIAGSFDIDGEAANLIDSTVDAVLQTALLDVQGSKWRNNGAVKLAYSDGKLQIDSLKMEGADGGLYVNGGLDAAGAISLNATVEDFDLSVAAKLLEFPKPFSGKLDCELSMSGEVSAPFMKMALNAREMIYGQLSMDNIFARISYKRGIAEVERATLDAFGGRADFRMMMPIEIDLMNPPTLDQLADKSIYASLNAKGINLGFIPLVAPEALEADGQVDDVRLEVTGELRQPKITGSLRLKGGRLQLKSLPVPIEDVNIGLSLTSGKGNGAEGVMEYRASTKLGWKMGTGRYNGEFSVTDAGAQALGYWHGILGIERPISSVSQPNFRLDLAVRHGQLDSFVESNSKSTMPPIGVNLSGEAHLKGEIGGWINEPIDPLTVLKLPLYGDILVDSFNLTVDGHKVKNRGKIRLSLADGKLEMSDSQFLTMPPVVDNASMVNEASRFGFAAASGRISADKTFDISVSGERIHPGIFSALADMPPVENGELDFQLDASGKLDSPVATFSLTARNLTFPVHPMNGKAKIDLIQCNASYEQESLKLRLDSFDNRLAVYGTVPIRLSLAPVAVEPLDQEMDIKLVMDDFDLSALNYFPDKIRNIRGIARAESVNIRGTLNDPILTGSFRLSDGSCQLVIHGSTSAGTAEPDQPRLLSMENVNMDISVENGESVTGGMSLQIGKGRYTAQGAVQIGPGLKPQKFDISFETSSASIDPFINLASPDGDALVSGEVSVNGHLEGDATDFQNKPILHILRTISGEVQIPSRGVKIDAAEHRIANPEEILAKLQNGIVNLRSLRLVDETAKDGRSSSIEAKGSWNIDGANSFDATLNLDMDLVSKLTGKAGFMSGWLTFELEAHGEEVKLFWPPSVESNKQSLAFGHAVIDRFEGELTYRDQELRVKQIRMSSGKNHAVFSGNIPMTGKKMDLRFDARLGDMSILSFINKDITESSGQGVISASITGDMRKVMANEEPFQFAGLCNFSNLDVNFYEANMSFEDIKADVAFNFGRSSPTSGFIALSDFRGKMNNGDFILNTGKGFQPGAEIIWTKEKGYNIGEIKDIPVVMTKCSLYQPGVFSILFHGKLVLKGNFNAPIVTGDITIQKGKYTESLNAFAQRLFYSREVGFKAFLDYPLVQDLELDVSVQMPGKMFMINSLVNVEAKASARVSGSLAKPIIAAQGQIIEGTFSYFGREFTITEGEIINKAEINPEYKIKAETEITNTEGIGIDMPLGSELKVDVELNGSLNGPLNAEFSVSGGGVSQQQDLTRTDIISILTLGATPGAFLDRGLSGSSPLLVEPAKWYVERRAAELLGLKEFQIQYDPNSSKETRLVIAKEIMKQISLLVDVGYGGQQWIGLQREMGKHFAFDGKVSQYGDWSFDLKVKRDFP